MIRGKSAHVSTPQLGADALYIASHAVVALQSLVTRLTSPVEPVTLALES
ncbi:peptidase dimerization domain-containing protein [Oscillibacter sp. CU971]|nr:peptidase dimerization domain-containing protein [uncultured Oscillibacter sp.]